MAMDTIFDFDNQEYVSDVKVFRDFFDSAVRSHNHSKSFGFTIGDKDFWESGFISTLLHPSKKDNGCPRGSKELIDSLVLELRHPMKQYNFDKDDGRGRIALPKRAHLICMNSLLAENEKKRNPQYKSIVLRSMQYDRFDISVICNTVRGDKTEPSCSLKSGGIRNGDMNRIHETLSGGGGFIIMQPDHKPATSCLNVRRLQSIALGDSAAECRHRASILLLFPYQ
nr:unnamed protein product [Haemonchus contortus]